MKKIPLLGALCAAVFGFISASSQAVGISGQGTWETTLLARDFDGDTNTIEGYYDRVLDITWLADANAAVGSVYDTYNPGSGLMDWTTAMSWAAGLNIDGITGWRLPTNMDDGHPGCIHTGALLCGYNVPTTSGSPPYPADTIYSEMASMFYDTLGNLAMISTTGINPQPGGGLSNTGLFNNLMSSRYYSSMEYSPDGSGDGVWVLSFGTGFQYNNDKSNKIVAWAVHSGDVGAAVVPLPAAAWLFGSGLLGLVGMARRKKA